MAWSTRPNVSTRIPDDLKPDTADLGRLGAGRTVVDRGKSQKPTSLRTILGLLRQTAELRRTKIPPKWYWNRHGEPPSFATLNQTGTDLGIPNESRLRGFGINHLWRLRHNTGVISFTRDALGRTTQMDQPSQAFILHHCAFAKPVRNLLLRLFSKSPLSLLKSAHRSPKIDATEGWPKYIGKIEFAGDALPQ
jgi:hypothetical protein